MMTFSTRLSRLEVALLSDDRPALVVAIEDDAGRLVDVAGEVIDPDDLGPRTLVVILAERPDGPA